MTSAISFDFAYFTITELLWLVYIKYLPLNIAKCEKKRVDMREKPVPVRVGKEFEPSESSMDAIKEETNFEKETTGENTSEDDMSKELPSMVSVLPLNSPNASPSKYNTRLYQTAIEYRPSLDIPGEFEFLNHESVSESQKQAVKFGVRVFRDWLHKQGVQFQSLEDMSRSEIANALEQFYLTARRPNGTQYKKNTLKSIKHSLDHYLRASPFKKDFSISTDYDFRQVNKTLDTLPEDANLNRFPQFSKEIILKLYQSGQLGLTTTDNPSIIIQTVWFYIVAYFFTSIDKRLLRELKETNLILDKDDEGREYYWLDYKPPDRVRGDVGKTRIYARPSSLCCPVAIIKKYIAHRNPRNDVLFQHPKNISNIVWYSPLPLGKNKHTDLMKTMCVSAGIDPPLTGRCIRTYVKELLQDCDEAVNKMFRLEGPPSSLAVHGVLVPKFPGDRNPSLVSPFILSVPRLPSSILSTSISSVSTIQSNHINIQPRTTTTSSDDTTNYVATIVTAGQNTNTTSSQSTTQGTYVTRYGRHFGNHIITNPPRISPISTVGAFPNGFVVPYPTSFPTIHDFAKPKESYHASQNSTPYHATREATHEIGNHQSDATYDGQGSPAYNGVHTSSNGSSIHDNASSIGNSPPFSTVEKSTISAEALQETPPSTHEELPDTRKKYRNATSEASTQTEGDSKQWFESAYHKADLKTRNKMRLQARKSLLCFLEELNEISDGHGTELFYEIVQEDTNMWKSIAKSTSSI